MPTFNPPGSPGQMLVSVPVPTPVPDAPKAPSPGSQPAQPKAPSVFKQVGQNASVILPHGEDEPDAEATGKARAAYRKILRGS